MVRYVHAVTNWMRSTTYHEAAHVALFFAAVNDPPTFIAGPPTVTVAEDFGLYSEEWATDISSGLDEDDTLTFTVSCTSDSAALFAVNPAVSSQGMLSFTPADNMHGSASCTVQLSDVDPAGGASDTAPLTIVVTPGEFQTPRMGAVANALMCVEAVCGASNLLFTPSMTGTDHTLAIRV
jgi:hypothetical protein